MTRFVSTLGGALYCREARGAELAEFLDVGFGARIPYRVRTVNMVKDTLQMLVSSQDNADYYDTPRAKARGFFRRN